MEDNGFEENEYHIKLTRTVLHTLRFICLAEMKRIFNFRISDSSQELLNVITEKYIITRLSRGFKTLDFYNEIKKSDDTNITNGG